MTFDPTPTSAPARVQAADAGLTDPGVAPPRSAGVEDPIEAAPEPEPGTLPPFVTPETDGSSTWTAVAGTLVAALSLAAGVLLWRRRRRRRRRRAAVAVAGGPADPGTDEALAALERALRRAGRELPMATTLLELERASATSPGVGAYARALAERRYGGRGAGPGPAERRALRRDLARGAGPLGWLRALWALPPRARLH